MNKYLYEKIEQTKGGAYIENLVFLANEACRERQSETFEDFTELETKEIAKILGWNDKKETLELIESEIKDECLSGLLLRHDKTGFIAECHMPECSSFIFKGENKDIPSSWSVNGGICTVFWIYADSIGELVEKLQLESENIFKQQVEKFLNKSPLPIGK